MRGSTFMTFLTLAVMVSAAPGPPASCPQVWTDVAQDLKSTMVGSDGKCNDAARAAIRLSFHDCFPGACDGSVILSDECTSRPENAQLTGICQTLGDKATKFKVSTADIIQLGAAIGIAACPGGPHIPFMAGRTDSKTANPAGQLPSPNDTAASILQAFASKGYSATELVALVGAHTAAKRIDGVALDTSVNVWDTKFYSETANGTAPVTLNSDENLSKAAETRPIWTTFANNAPGWTAAFVPAMLKMAVMGNDVASLVDCSNVIIQSFGGQGSDGGPNGQGPNRGPNGQGPNGAPSGGPNGRGPNGQGPSGQGPSGQGPNGGPNGRGPNGQAPGGPNGEGFNGQGFNGQV